jgi:glycosyltransferase involved in cell wall biosynthesis
MIAPTTSRARPRVLVAHAGKQHAYRHALAVQKAGCLEQFVTSSYYEPSRFPDSLFARSRRLDRALRRRTLDGLDGKRVVRRWSLELPELVARKLGGSGFIAEKLVYRRDAKFDRWVARRWAATADIYWGFQGSCLESLRAARRAGKIAVAEFATAHVTLAIRLLSAESKKHPEWADSISNYRFPDWYRERLEQEPHKADFCIAASKFTKQSLLDVGIPKRQIKLLPLGADLRDFAPSPRSAEGPFRVLFVGGVGQRKGIKYLLEAYRKMRSAGTELAIVGPLMGSGKGLEQYRGEYTYLGRLDQSGVVEQMRRCQVLVLPSVFEGFGLVIPEAMATGMPVIASTHSIGPEIVREGQDGFVLEPDDVAGLAAKLDWLASHRRQACEMGAQAAVQARLLSWQRHQERVREIIGEMVEERTGLKCERREEQRCMQS